MSVAGQRVAIVAEAQSWINTPFAHQGKVKGAGVDCGQLIAAVYETVLDWSPFDFGNYPKAWMLHRDEDAEFYLGIVKQHCVETREPLPGDIALFKYGRAYSHGAIVKSWPLVIHADARVRKVVLEDASKMPLAQRHRIFFTPFRVL